MTGPYRPDPVHVRALAVTAVQMLEADLTLSVRATAASLGIPHSAVYTAWRRRFPGRPPRGKGRGKKPAALPFATLCDVVLRHVPVRGEATAGQIFEAVRNDYGELPGKDGGERRLFRALRRLLDTGRVERVGKIFTAESGYRRSTTTMSKTLDTAALKRTALACDQDEWQWQDDGDAIEGVHDGQIELYVDEDDDGPVVVASIAVKAHIVAASPPIVVALCERIEELEAMQTAPTIDLTAEREQTQSMLDRIGVFDVSHSTERELLAVVRKLCEAMIAGGLGEDEVTLR